MEANMDNYYPPDDNEPAAGCFLLTVVIAVIGYIGLHLWDRFAW